MKQFTKSIGRGKSAEDKFFYFLSTNNMEFKRNEVGTSEQINKHVDGIFKISDFTYKVDIKSSKRISRSDDSCKKEVIWLEFKNVNGKKGWLLGESDYLAFQNSDSFYLIRRKDLLEWCLLNLDFGTLVKSSGDAYKKLYSRKGRKDLISYILLKDIKHLITWEIGEGFLLWK